MNGHHQISDHKPIPKPASTGRGWTFQGVLMLLLGIATFIAGAAYADTIKDRWYIFDHVELHNLAQTAVSLHPGDMPSMVSYIKSELAKKFEEEGKGFTINTEEEWIFNNAGGAMGAMTVLHASVTEYLIIFGTPLGTEGHTGRYWADDYFNILDGEQWAFAPGSFEKEVYEAGSVHHLPRGAAKQYKMHEGCFALEYARGWIPTMMPFGLIDFFTSTLDLQNLVATIRISAALTIKNLLNGKI